MGMRRSPTKFFSCLENINRIFIMSIKIQQENVWKGTLPTLGIYTGVFLFVFILDKVAPSDMCNPGLGMLLFLPMPFVVPVLFIRGIILDLGRQDKVIQGTTILHLAASILLWIMLLV